MKPKSSLSLTGAGELLAGDHRKERSRAVHLTYRKKRRGKKERKGEKKLQERESKEREEKITRMASLATSDCLLSLQTLSCGCATQGSAGDKKRVLSCPSFIMQSDYFESFSQAKHFRETTTRVTCWTFIQSSFFFQDNTFFRQRA